MSHIDKAFDELSVDYDSLFSETWLGDYYRARVQKHLADYWDGDKKIIELNAGTGEDACFLASMGNDVLATDISSQMLLKIEEKAAQKGFTDAINTQLLAIEELESVDDTFDGLLSNFGGLNCVEDLSHFAEASSRLLSDGGVAILCVMGPWVPWEWGWFASRGEFKKAVRRIPGKTQWRGADIYYPSVRQIKQTMKKQGFSCLQQDALGVLMPPSYVSDTVRRWPGWFKMLSKFEDGVAHWPFMSNWADHYLLIFEKQAND